MSNNPASPSESTAHSDPHDDDQSLLSATVVATPAQRLAWLEDALSLAYASGALKPRKLIEKEEWEAMGSSAR